VPKLYGFNKIGAAISRWRNKMTTKTITETVEAEKIIDDVSDVKIAQSPEDEVESLNKRLTELRTKGMDAVMESKVPQSEEAVNLNKLAELRAKNIQKQKEAKAAEKANKVERSIQLNFIGSGQCGNRLAEAWGSLGYKAIAINTASQDLKHINLPDSAKCLLKQEFQGASRELALGRTAAENNKQAIIDCINTNLTDGQVNVLCTSLGGGSGAGSVEVLIDILTEMGKPIIVQTVLPMASEDTQIKQNALETLQKLVGYARDKKIANLIVADNAKIESIFQNLSPIMFYENANKAMIKPLDTFNTYSSKPSPMKGLDPMEFLKIMVDSEGCTTYGSMEVSNYQEDTAIAECVINSLDGNLLASGFNLKTAKYVGFMIIAPKKIWESIPSSSANYALAMLNDICQPKSIFRGMYITPDDTKTTVEIVSIFAGMGLPDSRVNALKDEVKHLESSAKSKEEGRNLNLTLDTGNETISAAQKIKDKIAAKSSTFGKMTSGAVIDRRK
jgi:cell division GTPase FtsZ